MSCGAADVPLVLKDSWNRRSPLRPEHPSGRSGGGGPVQLWRQLLSQWPGTAVPSPRKV